MPEIVLHYIWQKMLYQGRLQFTTDGAPVEVLSPGKHNLEVGPDFSEAHLRIGGQEWVGDVEIHVSSQDWYTHRHHLDPAYEGVVLHVVRKADKHVYTSQMREVTQLVLDYPVDSDFLGSLLREALEMDSPWALHPCANRLLRDPELLTSGWRRALLHQRLECKRQQIEKILAIMGGSWEDAFYITLMRNFGFHTNSLPMEQLAMTTPLRYLQKHRNSLFQLTAILLGQSGLLTPDFHPGSETARELNEEEQALWREYEFLRKKFGLKPEEGKIWKRGRIRPTNSPELRIRQFAQLVYQSQRLFSSLMDASALEPMTELLRLKKLPEDANMRVGAPLPLGEDSIRGVIINTVIPYQYAYALSHGQSKKEAMDRALELMNGIPAENNAIIRQWRELGQQVQNASDTQALIHLYTNYCQPHQCMACDVGYQIFLQTPAR